MKIVYNGTKPMLRFGVEQIKQALRTTGTFCVEQFVPHPPDLLPEEEAIVLFIPTRKDPPREPVVNTLAAESFAIYRHGRTVFIEGGDLRGLLYGCLEWAERIERGIALADGEVIRKSPALRIRGVKYNLPYVPFETGEPFAANVDTCMDIDYWRRYLDMLALNRYNCLSLWSEHPFHLMVVSPAFREANPYTDAEIDRHIRFWKQLFRHAADRGVDVYVFTWNIRLIPEVARGLGLPEAVGDFDEQAEDRSRRIGVPLNRFRQSDERIKQYFHEMVLQLLITYPELKGLGVSASEWMDGDGYEKESWICDTYIDAIKQSGRDIDFIHRTNTQSAGREIKALVQGKFAADKFYISWKYSNAHAYSHPQPQFEQLWGAWEGIDLDTTQIVYTVRNDDVHTHRWGDPDYVREYVKGIVRKPYVKGFYWGSDGYVWGRDFQHADYNHKTWTYDFERHLYQFQLWGRLAFDPDTDNDTFRWLLSDVYGPYAADFWHGLKHASRIIPAVNRLFWLNYDMQWHPESCLSHPRHGGFKTILDFVHAQPMPGAPVVGIREYVKAEHEGKPYADKGTKRDTDWCPLPLETSAAEDATRAGAEPSAANDDAPETPIDILRLLDDATAQTDETAGRLSRALGEHHAGQLACTLLDLRSYVELGQYYRCKFAAALELNRYERNGNKEHKLEAVRMLEQAARHWQTLGELWSRHNKPYRMARVKMTFGYPLYYDNVLEDIEIAKRF